MTRRYAITMMHGFTALAIAALVLAVVGGAAWWVCRGRWGYREDGVGGY